MWESAPLMLVCLLRTTGEIYIEGETATRPTACKRIELQCLVLHEVAARYDELLARGLLPVMVGSRQPSRNLAAGRANKLLSV